MKTITILLVILAILAGGIWYFKENTKNPMNTSPSAETPSESMVLTATLRHTTSSSNQVVSEPPQVFRNMRTGETITLSSTNASDEVSNYRFKVVASSDNSLELEQVADENGKMNPLVLDDPMNPASRITIDAGKSIEFGPKTPGGGPLWTLVWSPLVPSH